MLATMQVSQPPIHRPQPQTSCSSSLCYQINTLALA